MLALLHAHQFAALVDRRLWVAVVLGLTVARRSLTIALPSDPIEHMFAASERERANAHM